MWKLIVPIFMFVALVFLTFQTGENRKAVYEPGDLRSGVKLLKIRVIGTVRGLNKIETGDSFYFQFELHDEKSAGVKTVYHGFKPELLRDGVQAMVDGDWDGSTLMAASVLTQCPSKYEPKDSTSQEISSKESNL
ncbi:MAG: cytochrome c maturation protein CcmE [Thermoplasmatales archaeon]